MAGKEYVVLDVDMAPELNRMADAHKAKGCDKPLFNRSEPFPFQPSFTMDATHFKRIEKDLTLRKLVEKNARPLYDQMLVELEAEVSKFAAKYPQTGPAKADLDKFWETLVAKIVADAEQLLKKVQGPLDEYLILRTQGKLEKQKYQFKKVKGGLKVTAGIAAIGGAIASTVASFGAAAPTVFVAFYGTYKGVRETQDAFKKAGRTYEKYAASIENTLKILAEKYQSTDPDEVAQLIAKGEAKSKVGKELLGFTGQSIKKLEESIKGYDKAVEIAIYANSRLGKELGELKSDIAKMEAYLSDLKSKAASTDGKAKDKLESKIKDAEEKVKLLKPMFEAFSSTADARYPQLLIARDASAPWKQIALDLKEKRPDWVRHISKPLKLVGIAAAAASMDATEAADDIVEGVIEIGSSLGGAAILAADENKKYAKKK